MLDRLINTRSNHGIGRNIEDKLTKASRVLALTEAQSRFPNSSEWSGLLNGPDMHVDIALEPNPAWYKQVSTANVAVTKETTAELCDDGRAHVA